jgi:hypothetical protein
MSISNNVFLSILAMDAYNRSYNVGIDLTGTQIGTASLGTAKGDAAAQEISFYAQSYTWGGQTVIAYRGTDDMILDPLYGWRLGAGYPETPQADMAARQ